MTARILSAPLNLEWRRLAGDPATATRLASWRGDAEGYRTLDELLAATSRTGGGTLEEADAVLAALVRRAAHDELAARVALQRLVPGLVLVANRRTSRHPVDRPALFDELVGTAWVVIRTYPIERRPVKIAANLLRETEYQCCTREGRLLRSGELALGPAADAWQSLRSDATGRPLGRPPHPADRVAGLLARAHAAGVREQDLSLLTELVLEGRSVTEVARERRVTPRTVYSRRLAVTARLAELCAA